MKKILKLILMVSILTLIVVLIFIVVIIHSKLTKSPANLEIGFNHRYPNKKVVDTYLTGVKSDTRTFDINDVSLDFYFGHTLNEVLEDDFNNDEFKFISIATYFYTECHTTEKCIFKFDNYRNIDGFHLIKEYSLEEFFVEDKKISVSKNKINLFKEEIIFNYYETLTIPSYLFDIYEEQEDEMIIYFSVFTVLQEVSTGKYIFSENRLGQYYNYYLNITFSRINNNKIIIKK